ncbi:BrnT family toxin [Desulfovibrio sp. OttesenSCG-928-M14]|nr:BrnT family toxin [Desulfovibrio sp. OttesenSCG-928-M14]
MKFEWDERKNLANHAKHKVSFELARLIFEDPLHLVKFDRIIDGEERWHAVGRVMDRHVLVAVHTYRNQDGEEIIRIISARRASSHERRHYEQG